MMLERLVELLAMARQAEHAETLDSLENEADGILSEVLGPQGRQNLDPHRMAALSLALQQVRIAIGDRRHALHLTEANLHRLPRLVGE